MALSDRLIFIHGCGTSPAVWTKQINCFSVKYKIETPSLTRGLPELTTDNCQLRTVLIGWSYGGMVALQMVYKNPGQFKALILAGSTARFTDEKNGQPLAAVKKIKRDLERDFEGTMRSCYKTFFSKGEKGYFEQFVNSQALPDKKITTEILDGLMKLDLRDILQHITLPVLLIHGDRDEVCPIGAARLLQEGLKGSRLEIIRGAGHMPFYTRPDGFNEILEGFVIDGK